MKRVNLLLTTIYVGMTIFAVSCASGEHHHDHGHNHEHTVHDHEDQTYEHEHDHAHEHEHDHEHEDYGHKHSDEIILEKRKAAAAGVEVEKVEVGNFHGVIHTSGSVMAASCDETTVVATISGRVGQTGHISEGMKVAAGATLYTLTSGDMQVAEGDPVQKSRIAYEQAKREYERAETLVKDKIISERDFQLAKSEFEAAKLTYDAISKNRSQSGVVIRAQHSGYVKQNLVKEGDYVEAGQPLMVITQNQHLYLRAEVPERYWNVLNRVICAKFRTSYSDKLYDITEMGGHITSYAHAATAGSAYVPIIFEFNNTGDVVQGSFAEIYLITNERKEAITVPLTAITEEQGLYYVYIRVDEDGYRKQLVTLGMNDGARIEILTGLNPNENVVVKGAMQVKLASASNAIPAHTHNH